MTSDTDATSIIDNQENDILMDFLITPPDEPLNNLTWFAYARQLQYHLYQTYSPKFYDRYNISNVPMLDELYVLKTKICYLRFGRPQVDECKALFELEPSEKIKQLIETSSSSNFNCLFDYYTIEQHHEAEKLAEVIVKQKNPDENFVDVCILFVCYWKLLDDNNDIKEEDEKISKVVPIPLFRIRQSAQSEKDNETVVFVDFDGRVYRSFSGYLRSNYLPAGLYCYPRDGFYNIQEASDADEKFSHPADALQLDQGLTPASSLLSKCIDIGDKISVVSSVGSLIVTGGAIAVGLTTSLTAAPIVFTGTAVVGGISALYNAFRGVGYLTDRALHKQSISITETEPRSVWITIASTAVAGASLSATKFLTTSAVNASNISKSAIITTNFLNGTNVAVSFAGLINNSHFVITKSTSKNKKPSKAEIMNLTLSALLFSHSVVNFKTANTIIEKASSARVSQIEQSLDTKKSQKGYARALQNLNELDIQTRNKRIIRIVNNVDNNRDFFRKVYDLTRANNRNGFNHRITFGENGGIIIGNQEFSPELINQLSKGEQSAFLNALNSSGIDLIKTEAVKHLKQLTNVTKTEKTVKAVANNDGRINVKNIKLISSIVYGHLPEIQKILENIDDPKNVELIITIAKDISNRLGFKMFSSFLEVVNLFKIWFMNQTKNKDKPKITTLNDGNPVAKDVMYRAFHAFHNDNRYVFKFISPEMAMKNYLTHFPLTSNHVISVNEYWQVVQNVFEDTTHQFEVVDSSVRTIETERWLGKCFFQETDKLRGTVLSFEPK